MTLIMHPIGHTEFSPAERIRQGQAALERVCRIVRALSVDINIGCDADSIWLDDGLRILPGLIKNQAVDKRCIDSRSVYLFERVPLPA